MPDLKLYRSQYSTAIAWLCLPTADACVFAIVDDSSLNQIRQMFSHQKRKYCNKDDILIVLSLAFASYLVGSLVFPKTAFLSGQAC